MENLSTAKLNNKYTEVLLRYWKLRSKRFIENTVV